MLHGPEDINHYENPAELIVMYIRRIYIHAALLFILYIVTQDLITTPCAYSKACELVCLFTVRNEINYFLTECIFIVFLLTFFCDA